MGGNELEVLEHYNRKIQKYGEHKDATEILLKCLCKLDQVRVNISLLQNTGIGRTVSALKKRYGDHEIGTRSRDLVNKWKDLVAQEENDEEDNGEAEDNEEEDSGEADPGAQQTDPEPPAYIPTPIAPAYTPTPIDELPTVAETSNGYGDMHDDNKHDKKAKSQLKEREKSSEKESDHHKSKKKKSHRERNSEEKEQSKSSVNGKSDRESEKRKEKERSHKHRHSDKERESKPGDKDRSSKEKVKDHRSSSKSSHKEKSKDSESDRKSDNKHSDKDKHRTKDKESKPRIKEEKCDSYDDKVKSKESVGSSGVKVKEERLDFGYGDVVNQKVKKEPVENGFDFMKENDLREIKKSKEKEKKSKEKSKEDERKKSKSRELANVDIFSKSMDNSDDESKSKKRSRDEERVDFSKSKRPKQDSTPKFVLPAPPSSLPPLPTGPSLIPEISPVYKPLPRLPLQNMAHVVDDRNTDEESLSILLSNKNKNRAAIYSGTKRKGFYGEVPTLFSQCIQVLKDHVDEIDEVGNLGYDILQPVLERATPKTLMHIEDCNPYLMEDTAELWEKYVKKDFRNKEREDMESWREMYERCTLERAEKLDALKGKVKQCYKAEEDNHRKTKLAYVDIAPKAPRSVRNAQAKHGTALPVGHSMVAGATRPRNQLGDPTASASRAGMGSKKPRTAPMMAKTLKLMKTFKGGFRR